MIIPALLLVLAVAGVFDAAYLTYIHLFSGGVCGPASSCGPVLTSPHSTFGGIPVAAIGLGFYLAVLLSAWRALWHDQRSEAIRWVSLLGLAGLLPTFWFLYLQAFVIRAYCPYCLLSACLVTTITVLAFGYRRNTLTLTPFFGTLSTPHLVPIILTLILAPTSARILQKGIGDRGTDSNPPEVVARIGDREITLAEMDAGIELKLYETRSEYRKEWLERQLLETAAKEAGMEARPFVQQEVYNRISVSPEEIDRRYEEIKPRLPKNVTKKMVTPNIRDEIVNRKRKSALDTFVSTLETRYGTTYTAPMSERFATNPNERQGPVKGSADAPVTIVEYSDLECSYCSRAHGYLNDLLERRGNDIRIIYKHYPLDMHSHARFAAEIAACAHKQAQFWPVADAMFREQKAFSQEKIMSIAEEAGLGMVRMNSCMESGEGKRSVEADIAEGDALGISSTPSFFVNGHYIGSLPPEGLDGLIDQELARVGR